MCRNQNVHAVSLQYQNINDNWFENDENQFDNVFIGVINEANIISNVVLCFISILLLVIFVGFGS